jgi:hypothetical protein
MSAQRLASINGLVHPSKLPAFDSISVLTVSLVIHKVVARTIVRQALFGADRACRSRHLGPHRCRLDICPRTGSPVRPCKGVAIDRVNIWPALLSGWFLVGERLRRNLGLRGRNSCREIPFRPTIPPGHGSRSGLLPINAHGTRRSVGPRIVAIAIPQGSNRRGLPERGRPHADEMAT